MRNAERGWERGGYEGWACKPPQEKLRASRNCIGQAGLFGEGVVLGVGWDDGRTVMVWGAWKGHKGHKGHKVAELYGILGAGGPGHGAVLRGEILRLPGFSGAVGFCRGWRGGRGSCVPAGRLL